MGCTATQGQRCTECGVLFKNPNQKIQHKCQDLTRMKPNVKPTSTIVSPSPQHYVASTSAQMKVKVPNDEKYITFRWITTKALFYHKKIKQFSHLQMMQKPFQEKLAWFRLKMQQRRISWKDGCDHLRVNRHNILMTSKIGIEKLNLYKEIKIQFDDEEVEDAGGLLREWMHLTIKQIFSPEIGIFSLCHTDQTAYKLVWDEDLVQQYANEHLMILGIIIGKAIFQRISLNCYLNKTILRQICQQSVQLNDVYSFDKDFYKQWSYILEENVEELGLDFSVIRISSKKKTQQILLVPDGNEIPVTEENKQKYVEKLIKLYCTVSVREYLQTLMKGIYKIIPPKYLSIFEPHELEMLMNGPDFIDVKDWKDNTQYQGYSHEDEVIQWFWKVVMEWNQQKLGHLLHYCTGSRCVPILGFKYLQSNRNMICRFKIRKIQVNPANPYPLSYTCFNRLELPEYPSFEQLEEKFQILVKAQLSNFGLA